MSIPDFKPVWAIKQSMLQHSNNMLKSINKGRNTLASIKKFKSSEKVDDEEGENIVDNDESFRHHTLSGIQCKPSITES